MKEILNVQFSRFRMQFGEDVNSDINQVLTSLVVTPTLNTLFFKVGIIDKKLEPFTILNKLIRVKRINMYLHVLDNEDDIVGTFKFENTNFKNISNYENFLTNFTNSSDLRKTSYDANFVKVNFETDNIIFDEVVLFNKESKKLEELNNLKGDSKISSVLRKRASYDDVEIEKMPDPGHRVEMPVTAFIGHFQEERVERAERPAYYEEAGDAPARDYAIVGTAVAYDEAEIGMIKG